VKGSSLQQISSIELLLNPQTLPMSMLVLHQRRLKQKLAKKGQELSQVYHSIPGISRHTVDIQTGRPEHGGNCDIKNLSRGSKVYLPVHVKGAKFSVGDLHFSQGDGEISFCGAIEMAGVITINFKVMKNGMTDLGMKSPLYLPGPVEPHYGPGRYLTFEGFSVDEHGKQVSRFLGVDILNFRNDLRAFGPFNFQLFI
jgi:acetamidase/formamidase